MTRKTSIDSPSHPDTTAIPFSSADLLVDSDGRVYHLQLLPEEVASDIIVVGDPGRAQFISEHFLYDIELRREHRGLRSFTGKSRYDGHRVSVITSGMGTPSLEIVIQEISILKHIDLRTRTPKPRSEPVQIIRVGTSGGLQASTPLGTAILTRYAIGFDNTGLFYETPAPDENCLRLERELYEYVQSHMPRSSRFYGRIWPYVTMASPPLLSCLKQIASECNYPLCEGITVSNSGFFANQGRDILPIHPSIPDLDLLLSQFEPRIANLRVENMEMEASALCHLGQGQGFFTACICPSVSNRRLETFADDYEAHVARAVEIALRALSSHRKVLGKLA